MLVAALIESGTKNRKRTRVASKWVTDNPNKGSFCTMKWTKAGLKGVREIDWGRYDGTVSETFILWH